MRIQADTLDWDWVCLSGYIADTSGYIVDTFFVNVCKNIIKANLVVGYSM